MRAHARRDMSAMRFVKQDHHCGDIFMHAAVPGFACAAALQGCHADDAGAGVLGGIKYLQRSAPVVPPWSGQEAISSPEMGIPLPSAELLQLAYPHSCQCHQMSEAQCTVHVESDTKLHLSAGHTVLTCMREFASEATSRVWLVSNTFCRLSITTSQLLALPKRPFAMTTRCFLFWLSTLQPVCCGSSCIV